MRSATSFFNAAIYKKSIQRFWPIGAANLLVWFLVLPMRILMRIHDGSDILSISRQFMHGNGFLISLGALFLAIAAAMAMCSHLYSSRSANFFGALPVRREGIFCSVFLAGLSMLLIPNLIIFLIMVPVELLGKALVWQPLLFWLATVCAAEIFFFTLAMFCGMFTGHILFLPVLYGVCNFFVLFLNQLSNFIVDAFYYGFHSASMNTWDHIAWLLTPVWCLSNAGCIPPDADAPIQSFHFEGAHLLIIYSAAALVLFVLTLLLYRRRRMETAGDVISVLPLRPVFHWGAAVFTGLLLGMATSMLLNLGEVGMIVSIAIWSVIGSFAAQMLLNKSLRVFHNWKSSAVLGILMILLFTGIKLDVTGYETRIPTADQVDSVLVSEIVSSPRDDAGYWSESPQKSGSKDPAVIDTVLNLHRLAVEKRNLNQEQSDQQVYISSCLLTYHLKNGKTLTRHYILRDQPDILGKEGSLSYTVQRLLDNRELLRQAYGFEEFQAHIDQGGQLSYYTDTFGKNEGSWLQDDYSRRNADALFEAVIQDFDQENLGSHRIITDSGILSAESWPELEDMDAVMYFKVTMPPKPDLQYSDEYYLCVSLPKTAENTWAILKKQDLS